MLDDVRLPGSLFFEFRFECLDCRLDAAGRNDRLFDGNAFWHRESRRYLIAGDGGEELDRDAPAKNQRERQYEYPNPH